MPEELKGHIKHDPVSGSVAIRTHFPIEDYPDMEWLVATVGSGASTKPGFYVEGWVDLFVPEPEPEPETVEPEPEYAPVPPAVQEELFTTEEGVE